MSDVKTKQFYFSKEDVANFESKESVSEYISGIIHQDKMLYIQVVVLPKNGLAQDTPFRILDEDGNNALETNKKWVSYIVPADKTQMKVIVDEKKSDTPTKKGKK